MRISRFAWSAALCLAACSSDETPSGGGELAAPGGHEQTETPAQSADADGSAYDGDGGAGPGSSGGGSGDGDPAAPTAGGVSGAAMSFEQHTLSTQAGAAYLHPEDLDGDGYPEILMTTLAEGLGLRFPPIGYGGAYVLRRDGGAPQGELGSWSAETVFDSSKRIDWPNDITLFDVDNDGVRDWVIGGGFLAIGDGSGSIVWIKGQEADGELRFGEPQKLSAVPDADYWYHVAAPVDMDGDGDMDFVTSSHKGKVGDDTSRLEWYENAGEPGVAKFEYHLIADKTGGALVELYDIDGDGDQDIFVPQFFHGESLLWFENAAGDGSAWTRHLVDDTTGRGFIVKLVDVNGDGKKDVLYANHNHQLASDPDDQVMGVYWWDIPGKDEVRGLADWGATKHVIYEGFNVPTNDPNQASAPGMINAADLDGDGDLDITVSGDGDPGLYVLQQQADGFELLTLDTGHSNSGAQAILDLDGDGDLDIMWAVFGPQGVQTNSHVFAFLQQ